MNQSQYAKNAGILGIIRKYFFTSHKRIHWFCLPQSIHDSR